MRYNESMRDHNHRTCCYLNCSVSYLKNAHRYHVKYLKATLTMSMTLCRTKDSVLVVGDLKCDRRGMKAWKATSPFFSYSFSQSAVLSNNDNDDDDVFSWREGESTQV